MGRREKLQKKLKMKMRKREKAKVATFGQNALNILA